eukprot:GHVN01042776.1.p1 GENE.GHVN01042776.1~~GHVN01042776.1.p1  ORF type:complete len:960 (+),score=85.50 GHVN01042776.1:6487-9366(+)
MLHDSTSLLQGRAWMRSHGLQTGNNHHERVIACSYRMGLAGAMNPTLQALFAKTLSPRDGLAAEQELTKNNGQPGFLAEVVLLLYSKEADGGARIAGSIYLKNLIRREWQDSGSALFEKRNEMRNELLSLVKQTEPSVRIHLVEAVSLIAKFDFPGEWPELTTELSILLSSQDRAVCLSGMKVVCAVFEKYRHEEPSDELYTEINTVMGELAPKLHGLSMHLAAQILQSAQPDDVLVETMGHLAHSIHSLSSQDLPAYFEEKMGELMGIFIKQHHHAFVTCTDHVARLKTELMEIATLYATKYSEDFVGMREFIDEVLWSLFESKAATDTHFVSMLRFLSVTAVLSSVSDAFGEDVVQRICESIVLPGLYLCEDDIEQFEDDPLVFVRTDIDGTALETKRHAAGRLLRALLSSRPWLYRPLSQLLGTCLARYAADPVGCWQAKDTAIYLLVCVSPKSDVSTEQGIDFVDIDEFFSMHVLKDLLPANEASHPMIKTNALRFLATFRKRLDPRLLDEALPLVVHSLHSKNIAVLSYSAFALERLLSLKRAGRAVLDTVQAFSALTDAAQALLSVLASKKTPQKMCENELLPKAIARIFVFCGDTIPNAPQVLSALCMILKTVATDPSFPLFNFFIFEAFGVFIKASLCSDAGTETVDQALSLFQDILQRGSFELMPFVFQILAYIVETKKKRSPEIVLQLLPLVFEKSLWLERGMAPALARFVASCMEQIPEKMVAHETAILGAVCFLLEARATETHSFLLAAAFVSFMPQESTSRNLRGLLVFFLTRLQNSRSPRLPAAFVLFLSVLLTSETIYKPLQTLSATFEDIQQGLFSSIIAAFFSKAGSAAYSPAERKIVASAVSLLIEGHPMDHMPGLIRALLRLEKPAPRLPVQEDDAEDLSSFRLTALETERKYAVTLQDTHLQIKRILRQNTPEQNALLIQGLSKDERETLKVVGVDGVF